MFAALTVLVCHLRRRPLAQVTPQVACELVAARLLEWERDGALAIGKPLEKSAGLVHVLGRTPGCFGRVEAACPVGGERRELGPSRVTRVLDAPGVRGRWPRGRDLAKRIEEVAPLERDARAR